MNSSRSLVTIATYNEIETLPTLVRQLFDTIPNLNVLVIDDNSPDGTATWCESLAQTDPRLRYVVRRKKLGLGTAIVTGLRYAIEHEYQFVINMDGDLSHDPQFAPMLLDSMDAASGPPPDVVVGSRYVLGGSVKNWPRKRWLMSKTLNFYASRALGLPIQDCSSGYRCYRTETLKHLDFAKIRSRGFSFQEEVLWRLCLIGASIAEIPIVFTDRKKGASKINLGECLSAAWILSTLRLFEHRAG